MGKCSWLLVWWSQLNKFRWRGLEEAESLWEKGQVFDIELMGPNSLCDKGSEGRVASVSTCMALSHDHLLSLSCYLDCANEDLTHLPADHPSLQWPWLSARGVTMAWASFAALEAVTSQRSTSGTAIHCIIWTFPVPSQTQRNSMSALQSWWSVWEGLRGLWWWGKWVDR